MKGHRFFLAGLLAVGACQPAHGTHQSQLKLEYFGGEVVPSFARDLSGVPFSGQAYGTLFGDTSMDCVEWEGTFSAGRPDGQYLIHSDCNSPPLKIQFEHGVRVTVPNNSFKPKPLRGSA